jgi:hypothetical protein
MHDLAYQELSSFFVVKSSRIAKQETYCTFVWKTIESSLSLSKSTVTANKLWSCDFGVLGSKNPLLQNAAKQFMVFTT